VRHQPARFERARHQKQSVYFWIFGKCLYLCPRKASRNAQKFGFSPFLFPVCFSKLDWVGVSRSFLTIYEKIFTFKKKFKDFFQPDAENVRFRKLAESE